MLFCNRFISKVPDGSSSYSKMCDESFDSNTTINPVLVSVMPLIISLVASWRRIEGVILHYSESLSLSTVSVYVIF